jgi:hypothetical protein
MAHTTVVSVQQFPARRETAMPDVAALQQIERPQLQGRVVLYSDAQHLLIIDGAIVPCTQAEYDLLLTLLKRAGEPVPFARLLGTQERQTLTQGIRRSLTQQVSRLRARFWPYELDILCLNTYGYLLLCRSHEHIEEG